MTREEAAAIGCKTYTGGRPCKHGHPPLRLTRNGDCVECQLVRSSKWKRDNRSQLRESNRKTSAQWKERNPERSAQIKKKSYERLKLQHSARMKKWRNENAERVRQFQKEYRKRHPKRVLATNRARKAGVTFPLTAPQRDWMSFIYESCPKGWHVDHILPLRGLHSCGLHVPWNLQHLPAKINQMKSNKIISL